MKKLLKSLMCLVLCLCMVMPTAVMSSAAAAVGKVSKVTLVSRTTSSLKIKWTKVKNAKGYQVAFYNAAKKKWVSEKTTTALSYTDTGLKDATTYSYKVRAYTKKNGKVVYGNYSPVLKATTVEAPVVLKRVENVTAAASTDSSITLKWPKVSGATGYYVFIYNKYQKSWGAGKATSALSYTFNGLATGASYSFRVRAYAKKNGKVYYGKYSPTLVAQTLPQAVSGLAVNEVTEHTVSLSWDKAKGAVSYVVVEYDPATKKYTDVADSTLTSCTVSDLDSLSTHLYAVRSVAKNGSLTTCSAPCKTVSATTLLSTVESITATVSKNRIEFRWPAVNGAEDYTIYRCGKDNVWKDVATTSDTVYSFEDLEPGTEYMIRFTASAGKLTSQYSQTFRLSTTPDVPKNLKAATTSEKTVALTWDAAKGASGYEVLRYSPLDGTEVVIGTCEANSFIDTSLETNTDYCYKVRAFTVVNGKYVYGDYCEKITHSYTAAEDPNNPYKDMGKLGSAGVLGYLYDPERDVFYTAKDPWQRNFGFNVIYDVSAQLILLNYKTNRFKFNANGKDWMIQFWKGHYGLVIYGGEIGVYTKPVDRVVEHYDCASDEDMLRMSLKFYQYDVKQEKWVFSFERPYGLYWWCTGFKIGNNGGGYDTKFSNYRIDARITMKNFEMLDAFTKSLRDGGQAYTVDGLDVYLTWI